MKPHSSFSHVIMIVGSPGSGKTFFGEKFSETFGVPFINMGRLAGLCRDHTAAKELTETVCSEILKTKHSFICELASGSRVHRTEIARKARAQGYRPLIVWIQTDTSTAKSRWLKQTKGDHALFDQLQKEFSPPHPSENYLVISGKYTYSTQAKILLRRLSDSDLVPSIKSPERSLQRNRNPVR